MPTGNWWPEILPRRQLATAVPYLSGRLTLLTLLLLLGACTDRGIAERWEYASFGLSCGALTHDARWALVGDTQHGGSLWGVAEHSRRFNWNHRSGEQTVFTACGFSPEGGFALTASRDSLVLWSTVTGNALTFWAAPAEVHDLALSADGNFALLALGDSRAVLFDVKNGGVLRSFNHDDRVLAIALSGDGELVITGSEDFTARIWEVQSGRERHRWRHQAPVTTVAISEDGRRSFSAARYEAAALRDTDSGDTLWTLPQRGSALRRGQTFSSAQFVGAEGWLATGTSDRQVVLWDVDGQRRLGRWQVPRRDPVRPTSAAILALAMDTERRLFALGSNGFNHRLD